MENKIIIIAGHPASGKTTFALKLSEILYIPFFNLDSIKTAIGKEIIINNWEDSKRLGKSSFWVSMYIVENMMKVNNPLIIENSFIKDHEIIIKYLLEKYEYKTLTYILKCDLDILHKRFIERERSPERDASNKIFGLWDDFKVFEHDMKFFDDFNIGDKIVNIITNDFSNIDFNKYINIAKEFFNVYI
jgi:deoxyadenosine/deoxycytidine kinase